MSRASYHDDSGCFYSTGKVRSEASGLRKWKGITKSGGCLLASAVFTISSTIFKQTFRLDFTIHSWNGDLKKNSQVQESKNFQEKHKSDF